jgi:hypothetical protein
MNSAMRHTVLYRAFCVEQCYVQCHKIPDQEIFMAVSSASFNAAGILVYNDGHHA